MGPVFRYVYLLNNSSTTVVATVTPDGAASSIRISPPIVPSQSARTDLFPTSPTDEMHNLGLGVVDADTGKINASAGSFFTYESGQNMTVYTSCTGDTGGLTLAFNGFGPDPSSGSDSGSKPAE